MVTNERQYKITKAQAQKFLEAINNYDINNVINDGVHPLIAQAQLDQMRSEYDVLIGQLHEYDELSSGNFEDFGEASFEELPLVLIRARIARNWTQKEFAEKLDIKQQQVQRYESELYSSCKYSTLVRISKVLGLVIKESAALSNNLTQLMDGFPFNEVFNRGWFVDFGGSLSHAKRVKNNLIESFYINSGVTEQQISLHKKKVRKGGSLNEYALNAWQARVIYKTKLQKLHNKFNPSGMTVSWFKELAKLSVLHDGPVQAKNFLLSSGIHFIIEPHLQQTHLDGAAMCHPNGVTPIISCTLRHDRLDNFWFVLFHELAHLHLHFNSDGSVDYFDNDIDEFSNDIEKEADDFALNSLIPNDLWDGCLSRFSLDIDTVRQEAKNLQVHSSILAGRIRREQGNYLILNDAVGYGEVRKQFPNDCINVPAQ